jgi:hypothetical protein
LDVFAASSTGEAANHRLPGLYQRWKPLLFSAIPDATTCLSELPSTWKAIRQMMTSSERIGATLKIFEFFDDDAPLRGDQPLDMTMCCEGSGDLCLPGLQIILASDGAAQRFSRLGRHDALLVLARASRNSRLTKSDVFRDPLRCVSPCTAGAMVYGSPLLLSDSFPELVRISSESMAIVFQRS